MPPVNKKELPLYADPRPAINYYVNLFGMFSAAFINTHKNNLNEEHIDLFRNVRLIILDEVSFTSESLISKLNENLYFFNQCWDRGPFGNMNIAFLGDFRQLPPVNKKDLPLYADPSFPHWRPAINCYVKLYGMFRFANDPEFGEICRRIQEGNPTDEDFEKINLRYVGRGDITDDGDRIPDGTVSACTVNKERDSINTSMFRQYVQKNGGKKCLMVLADSLKIYKDNDDKEGQIHSSPEVFYNECGEDDCKFGRSTRMDPIVKLYPSCPLMLTQNDSVRGGIANGTKCSFVAVVR